MQLTLITVLAAVTLASSVSAITHCTLESLQDAASHELCGDQVEVSRCLSVLEEEDRLAFLKECLLAGGCSEEEAVASVQRVADSCTAFQDDEFSEDLKRRANDKDTTTTTATTTNKATEADKTTTTSTETTASTTSTTSTSSTTSQSTVTSTSSTSSTSDSTTTSSTITTTDTSNSTLQCLTTSQQSMTWCVTTTDSGGAVNSACIPTTSPVITCAPGLICQTQAAGDTTCMIRQNGLTTSGWVVTIVFGLVVAVFFTTCCTMCIKTRQQAQRKSAKAKASMVGGNIRNTPDVEASNVRSRIRNNPGAEASDSHLPLMAAQGPIASSNSSMRDAPTDYNAARPTAHRVPSSSYQDVVASRKPAGALPVYPGPSDMGPDYSDMGNGRGRQGR